MNVVRLQVGKDARAAQFLGTLDKDPMVGRMIDCVSDYELEQASSCQLLIMLNLLHLLPI